LSYLQPPARSSRATTSPAPSSSWKSSGTALPTRDIPASLSNRAHFGAISTGSPTLPAIAGLMLGLWGAPATTSAPLVRHYMDADVGSMLALAYAVTARADSFAFVWMPPACLAHPRRLQRDACYSLRLSAMRSLLMGGPVFLVLLIPHLDHLCVAFFVLSLSLGLSMCVMPESSTAHDEKDSAAWQAGC